MKYQFLTILASTVFFDYLFWESSLGLNLVLYNVLISLVSIIFQKESLKKTNVKISIGIVTLTGITFLIQYSSIALFTHIISTVLLIGFINDNAVKSISYSFYSFLIKLSEVPKWLFQQVRIPKTRNKYLSIFSRNKRIIFVPLIAFSIFFLLFYFANKDFARIVDYMLNLISEGLETIFGQISIFRILFYLIGLIISTLFIAHLINKRSSKLESTKSILVVRKRKKLQIPKPILALKTEYRTALMLVILVNVLLIFVNYTDIYYIWFNFKYEPGINLSQFVHEGTYLLILSILLSMGILLYYFNRNLNFYKENSRLKFLAIIWIIQNAILVISVGVRTYHYINNYGLAYKRIGVLIFLTCVTFGLITLALKITKRKSSYYLIKNNSWFVLGVFVFISTINWDKTIAKHNLSYVNQENLDLDFLFSLSSKTIPILIENRAVFEQEKTSQRNQLKWKIVNYWNSQKNKTWQEWNYQDYQTTNFLKKHYDTFTKD